MGSTVFEAIDVYKRYGKTEALKGVSLKVEEGEIFSLLGPNGAGKTTLLKSLLNLTPVQSGKLNINGIDSRKPASRREIVFLPEVFQFYPDFTVEETVIFLGLMHGIPRKIIREKIPEALDKFSLREVAARKNRTLSKGQLQRTALAHVHISGVRALILDEPFSGLDLLGIKTLEEDLISLQKEGKTILICSHALHELEKFSNCYAILKEGVCVTQGRLNPPPASPGGAKKSVPKRKTYDLEKIYLDAVGATKGARS